MEQKYTAASAHSECIIYLTRRFDPLAGNEDAMLVLDAILLLLESWGWPSAMAITNGWLMNTCHMSEPTVRKYRDMLRDAGLFDFVSGTKRRPVGEKRGQTVYCPNEYYPNKKVFTKAPFRHIVEPWRPVKLKPSYTIQNGISMSAESKRNFKLFEERAMERETHRVGRKPGRRNATIDDSRWDKVEISPEGVVVKRAVSKSERRLICKLYRKETGHKAEGTFLYDLLNFLSKMEYETCAMAFFIARQHKAVFEWAYTKTVLRDFVKHGVVTPDDWSEYQQAWYEKHCKAKDIPKLMAEAAERFKHLLALRERREGRKIEIKEVQGPISCNAEEFRLAGKAAEGKVKNAFRKAYKGQDAFSSSGNAKKSSRGGSEFTKSYANSKKSVAKSGNQARDVHTQNTENRSSDVRASASAPARSATAPQSRFTADKTASQTRHAASSHKNAPAQAAVTTDEDIMSDLFPLHGKTEGKMKRFVYEKAKREGKKLKLVSAKDYKGEPWQSHTTQAKADRESASECDQADSGPKYVDGKLVYIPAGDPVDIEADDNWDNGPIGRLNASVLPVEPVARGPIRLYNGQTAAEWLKDMIDNYDNPEPYGRDSDVSAADEAELSRLFPDLGGHAEETLPDTEQSHSGRFSRQPETLAGDEKARAGCSDQYSASTARPDLLGQSKDFTTPSGKLGSSGGEQKSAEGETSGGLRSSLAGGSMVSRDVRIPAAAEQNRRTFGSTPWAIQAPSLASLLSGPWGNHPGNGCADAPGTPDQGPASPRECASSEGPNGRESTPNIQSDRRPPYLKMLRGGKDEIA